MMPGVPERRSFDYVRRGMIDLFAALNITTGKVISKLPAQHRAVDFRDLLDQIDRQADPGLAVHVICGNLSTHKAPTVQRWLLTHPRFVLHFTPHLLPWINQVERWLTHLQRRCLERGVFCSLDELTSALEEWIKLWNEGARPFKWTKTPDQITDRICRYSARISGPGHYVPMASGGFSYTAFVSDAFARLVPGWKVASHLRTRWPSTHWRWRAAELHCAT
jgi:transposase